MSKEEAGCCPRTRCIREQPSEAKKWGRFSFSSVFLLCSVSQGPDLSFRLSDCVAANKDWSMLLIIFKKL